MRSPLGKDFGREPRAAFLARAADVIAEYWLRLRTCGNPECGNLFLPVKRQLYCSTKCSQKIQWEKYTKAHPNRKRERDYKAEYERRKGGA